MKTAFYIAGICAMIAIVLLYYDFLERERTPVIVLQMSREPVHSDPIAIDVEAVPVES